PTLPATELVLPASLPLARPNAPPTHIASPYSVSWNTTTATNGSHTLTAVARDAAGNTSTSAAVTVTVNNTPPDTTPPTDSITSPAPKTTRLTTSTVSGTSAVNFGNVG